MPTYTLETLPKELTEDIELVLTNYPHSKDIARILHLTGEGYNVRILCDSITRDILLNLNIDKLGGITVVSDKL